MNFSISKDQQELRELVCEFIINELAPISKEIDKKGEFPREIVSKMADKALLGLPFPKEYGGLGMDMISYCIAIEELAKECRSTATINVAHVFTALAIHLFGSQEQKVEYLTPMAKGKKLGAFGIAERTGGSDVASIQTEAKVKGNEYVINGEKSYITNAGQAECYIILAFTDKTKGSKGLSAFIIEKASEGLSFGKTEDLIGLRGISLGEILLKDCAVPKENIIGNEGDGMKIVLSCIDRGRIGVSAIGVGLAQGALNASIEYSKKRSQFGRPISEFQATQFSIADMATQIEAARLLMYYAASLVESGSRFSVEASMAKLYSSEVAMQVAINAIQIHGGYGLSKDGPVERYMRDAKALAIAEGTSEIQRTVIARNKLK